MTGRGAPALTRRSAPAATRRGTALLAGALLLAACGAPAQSEPSSPAPDGPPLTLVTELRPGEAEAVGEAVNRFGFDLLGEVTDGTGNAIISPLSTATLLAMVLAGAGGETATAMAQALHAEGPRDARVGALLDGLAGAEEVTLSVGNALWADPEIPFEPDYLATVRETFDATLEHADLGQPAAAEAVDAWVDEHTGGRIPQIAEDLGLPDPDMALVLLNAVYFLGEWKTRFDPADTVAQPFTLAGGGQTEVPLMHLREQRFEYAERDGYRMLRLPYGQSGRFGMELLVPDPAGGAGGLAALLDTLDAAEWRAATGSLAERTVDELALPRFQAEWGGEPLNEPLARLGMGPALDAGSADFSPMSPADLYLETVVHKTFVQVDEAGTEAAAVTGGGMSVTSAEPPLAFRVDRPFAFTISDTGTGAILFLGAVADPRG